MICDLCGARKPREGCHKHWPELLAEAAVEPKP